MMSPRARWLCVAALASAVPLVGAEAQVRVPMPANAKHVCDGRLLILSVRVTDHAGAPVEGAVITVRNAKTHTLVSRSKGQKVINGFYMVMDDGYQPKLGAHGSDFDIIATREKSEGRTRWHVGMDASGCHIARLAGADTITLK